MKHHPLNFQQFQTAIAATARIFAKIRQKYPTLRAYLVLLRAAA